MSKKSSILQRVALVFFGFFLAIATLEIGLRLGGFIILSLQERNNLRAMKQRGACRIMCLGESTTQGEYPPYLEKALNQRNSGIKFSVIDRGVAGINTKTIVSQLEANLDKYQPDIVVTMMGINDWGDHIPYDTPTVSKMALFIRSLKVYKLYQFIQLHARAHNQPAHKLAWLRLENKTKAKDAIASEQTLKRTVELNPNDDSAYARLGWFCLDKKRFVEALDAFKKALALNPKNDFAEVGLGRFYLEEGQMNKALDALKKALALNPKNDFAYVTLGRLYSLERMFPQAEISYRKAIELNPGNDLAYAALGWIYLDKGNAAEAGKSLKKAIEVNPRSDFACVGLGRLCSGEGMFPEAEAYYMQAIELNPKSDFAYMGLGQLYASQGKFHEAEEALKKSLELNPQNSQAYIILGRIYSDQNIFPEAEEVIKKVIKLNPKNDAVYATLGQIYSSQRRFSQAEEVLNKALELNNKNSFAYTELGWIYFDQGKFPQAETVLKKAIKLNPHNNSAYAALGRLYSGQGRFLEAEYALKKVIELNYRSDRVYGGLATVYNETGNSRLAREYENKANNLRERYYSPITIDSYYKLKQILDKRKIKLACVQYPMRSIVPLKKILGEGRGVIFVDNEKIFKDAIAKDGYRAYFRDMFGGEFGHCTPKGNSLLASNIAEAILGNLTQKGL